MSTIVPNSLKRGQKINRCDAKKCGIRLFFQTTLLDQFPIEAGQMKEKRTIPYLPGLVQVSRGAVTFLGSFSLFWNFFHFLNQWGSVTNLTHRIPQLFHACLEPSTGAWTDHLDFLQRLDKDATKPAFMRVAFAGKRWFSRDRRKIATERKRDLTDYCKDLIAMKDAVSKCKLVTEFFAARDTDHDPPQDARWTKLRQKLFLFSKRNKAKAMSCASVSPFGKFNEKQRHSVKKGTNLIRLQKVVVCCMQTKSYHNLLWLWHVRTLLVLRKMSNRKFSPWHVLCRGERCFAFAVGISKAYVKPCLFSFSLQRQA